MGALGFHHFQTDIDGKWLANLLSQNEISLLYQAFHKVIETDLPMNLGVNECYVAVIAAEILSQMVGYSRVPPIIEADEIEQLAAFLTYDQCKLRLLRLAIESTKRILSMEGNLAILKQQVNNQRDGDLGIDATEDLLYRLRMAEKRFSVSN